jgi:hypothetical protein
MSGVGILEIVSLDKIFWLDGGGSAVRDDGLLYTCWHFGSADGFYTFSSY